MLICAKTQKKMQVLRAAKKRRLLKADSINPVPHTGDVSTGNYYPSLIQELLLNWCKRLFVNC